MFFPPKRMVVIIIVAFVAIVANIIITITVRKSITHLLTPKWNMINLIEIFLLSPRECFNGKFRNVFPICEVSRFTRSLTLFLMQ